DSLLVMSPEPPHPPSSPPPGQPAAAPGQPAAAPGQPAPGPGQPWGAPVPGAPPTAVLAAPAAPPEFPTAEQALAAAPPTPKRADWRRMLFLGGITAFIALSGLAVIGFVGWKIGPLATLIGIGAAILPVPLLVYCFLWL